MFDIGMAEMLVIGVVALIVVGPKDLPMMFRKVGNFVGRARGMARDFQRAMDQAADDTGVKDIKSSFDDATDLKNLGLDDVQSASKSFGEQFDGVSNKITDAVSDKSTPAAKPATKKAAAKKTAAKKAPAKKPAAKKPAAKKAPAKKPAAKKPASKAKS